MDSSNIQSTPVAEEQILDRQNVARLIFMLLLILVFIMAARSPIDSDLWWHLRAGDEMLNSWQPLTHDLFSFTRLGANWVNHSWLSEIFLAELFRLGNFMALGGLVAVLASASMAMVYAQMNGPALLKAFILVLASAVTAPVWTARPQLFSLLLLAFTGWLLFQYKWRQKNTLWVLVPTFILWSNLHGGYPLGLMLCGSFIAGEVINHGMGSQTALSWRQIRALLFWSVAAFLVVVINPNGFKTWLIPFQTINVSLLQLFIQEWASPDFHELAQQPFLWMLLALLIALGLSRQMTDGSDLVCLVVFGYLALTARRNFGPFALVAAPILSRSLVTLSKDYFMGNHFPDWMKLGKKRSALPARVTRIVNLTLVGVLALIAFSKLYIVTLPVLIASQVNAAYPVQAVNWLKENHPEGNLFNAYNWGGYLVWSLPEYPVFVDGRTDLFGDEILGDWVQVVQGQKGWQATLDRWNIRLMLLEPYRPVVSLLAQNGWKPVLQQEGYVLYAR